MSNAIEEKLDRIIELLEKIAPKEPRKRTPKVKKEVEYTEEEELVAKLYKEAGLLRPGKTMKGMQAVKMALKTYSLDEIADAINFATTSWYAKPSQNENYKNLMWFMNNIGNFMPGGKYGNKRDVVILDSVNDDIDDLF